MPSIFEAYIAQSAGLAEFFVKPCASLFDGPPEAPSWDEAVLTEIRTFQQALGHPATLNGSESVIVTGQQPGLFTGPLYTIYKAVGAILLARLAAERTGAPFIPMFWIGADDHDFEEVRTAHVLTRNHESLALRYAPEDNVDAMPLYCVPLSPALHTLIDEAATQAPGSEFRDEVAAFLHKSVDESATLASWFARLMARLFRDTPLVFFAPYLPEARKAAASVIEKAILDPLATSRIVNEAGERLKQLGFEPQVVKGPTECGFFLEMGDRRRKVLFENGRFVLPEERISCTKEEMLLMLSAAPERFSPNVVLRCVVRQALLPVAAYMAGPGEIGYWAQTKELFAHFGYPMPVVYPRPRACVVTTKTKKLLDKFGFKADELHFSEDVLLERALRAVARHPALEPIEKSRGTIENELQVMVEAVRGLSLKSTAPLDMAQSSTEQISAVLARLERSILRADEAQTDAMRKQVLRLRNTLSPERIPQERYYCVLSFLFEHGWEFMPRLLRSLSVTSFDVQEVAL
jgi:bacillithiol synthase